MKRLAAIVEGPRDTIEPSDPLVGSASAEHGRCGEDLDLPLRVARQRALSMFERLYLIALLRRYEGSIKHTARHAGVTGKHVRSLIKRYGINRRDFRPRLGARGSRSKAVSNAQSSPEPTVT